MSTTKAILLVAAVLLPLPADAAKSCHVMIDIYNNGDVTVDGKRYSDQAQLKRRLSEYGKSKIDCEVVLKGDRMMRYDSVARVLAMLQGIGYMKIGILTEPRSL